MTKQLLTAAALLIAAHRADAQLNCNLTVLNQAYIPLSGATSINGSLLWDEENFRVPLGFTFLLNGNPVTNFNLVSGQITATDTNSNIPVSGFLATSADLWDRGNASSSATSQSPIRYLVTGTAPSRIFKAELFNAGFFDEDNTYGTNNDSLSYQVWLYESSNIFEIHYGPSQITHPTDYFQPAGKDAVGYFKNLDFNSASVDMFYYLKGNPLTPTIDSTNSLLTFTSGLNSYPATGTVYRFTPKPTAVKDALASLKGVSVYPTLCSDEVVIDNGGQQPVSYRISGMNGAVAASGQLGPGSHHIKVAQLPAGVYTLHLQSADGQKVVKLTKR